MSRPSVFSLWVVYGCLVSLWLLTYALAEIPFPPPWHLTLALVISTAKTLLIMAVFMHLSHSPPLNRLVACAGFFWLSIMLGLALSDFLTRGWFEGGPI